MTSLSTPAVRVPFLSLAAVNDPYRDDLRLAFERVVEQGDFGCGAELEAFEAELAATVGARHAVGVSSGTSAVKLALAAGGVGPGDEVLLPANTFFATAGAVVELGGCPVAIDTCPASGLVDLDAVDPAVTDRAAALVVVHLYGNPVDMVAARAVADRHGLLLVEDAAQALGAAWDGRPVGSLADASAFSFYPTKNLGALGQAGAVTTGSDAVAADLRRRREHGQSVQNRHDTWGANERLDGLQAAFLRAKLAHFPAAQAHRASAAAHYDALLDGVPAVERYAIAPGGRHAHHLYAVRVAERDRVREGLAHRGIGTGVHYPTPVHRQPAWAAVGPAPSLPHAERHAATTLSLPFWPGIAPEAIGQVVEALAAETAERGWT